MWQVVDIIDHEPDREMVFYIDLEYIGFLFDKPYRGEYMAEYLAVPVVIALNRMGGKISVM